MRSDPIKAALLRFCGMLLCILPPVLAILFYFPIWIAEGGEGVIPGFTVLLISIAALPLYRLMKRALESAASWTLWLTAFVLFLLLSRIADEMTVISFTGFVGNALGAVLFKLSERIGKRE